MAAIGTDSMVRIASAGGGLDINGGVGSDSAIRIAAAAAASGKRPTIIFRNCGFGSDSMVKIAAAGQGCVVIVV